MSDDLQPIGEGWTRHNAELLVHPPSQVFFAQRGDQRGKYLLRGDKGDWTVCPAPHESQDCPIEVRAAAASVLRPVPAAGAPASGQSTNGATERKLERAVVIAEMPKTARLALKFPLGFLDSPAAAYALFSGIRGSAAAAQWCASQFHQRLLPEIAKRIHGWWDSEAEMPEELLFRGSHVASLAELLRDHLQGLDRDLLSGSHGFSGCDAVLAVIIGENLVVATMGQAAAILLFEDAEPISLIAAPEAQEKEEEGSTATSPTLALGQLRRGRVAESGMLLGHDGLLRTARSAWDADEVSEDAVFRILRAPDAFTVLGVSDDGPSGTSEVRTAYKRLALRVHPDKVRDCDPEDAKAAFERLEAATRAVEAMAEHDGDSCRELHRMLRCDPFTLRGAASLLQVETDADEDQVDKALKKAKELLAKLQDIKDAEAEVRRSLEACRAAVETLQIARRGGTPGAAGERLLAEGVPIARLHRPLGLRDLRTVAGAPVPRTAAWRAGEALRVALCCGATAELSLKELEEGGRLFHWQAKASALQWASKALSLPGHEQDSSSSSICICIRDRFDDDETNMPSDDFFGDSRPAKRHKGPKGPKSIRLRHLLLRCAEPGKPLLDDPMARRPKGKKAGAAAVVSRTPAEAETELIAMLKGILSMEGEGDMEKQRLVAFRKLCQQHSECSSADNAGQLCGDLGWISRGQGEASFEQTAFSLRVGELSDVVTTSRGVHLIQRLA